MGSSFAAGGAAGGAGRAAPPASTTAPTSAGAWTTSGLQRDAKTHQVRDAELQLDLAMWWGRPENRSCVFFFLDFGGLAQAWGRWLQLVRRVRCLWTTHGAAGSKAGKGSLAACLAGAGTDGAAWGSRGRHRHDWHRMLQSVGKAANDRVGGGDGVEAVRCGLAGLWWSLWTHEAGRVQV